MSRRTVAALCGMLTPQDPGRVVAKGDARRPKAGFTYGTKHTSKLRCTYLARMLAKTAACLSHCYAAPAV